MGLMQYRNLLRRLTRGGLGCRRQRRQNDKMVGVPEPAQWCEWACQPPARGWKAGTIDYLNYAVA